MKKVKTISPENTVNSIRGMTLSELIQGDESEPLFVINCSDQNGTRTKGDILMTIRMNNESSSVKIPNTWIPVDLTEYGNRKAIIDSANFRRLINRDQLKAIPAETAHKILETEAGRDEKTVLYMRENNIDDKVLQETALRGSGPESRQAQRILDDRRKSLSIGEDNSDSNITPQVVNIVNRNMMTPREMLASLRSLSSSITEKDLHYIIAKVSPSTHSAVLVWARETIANNQDDDDEDGE